MRNFAEEWKREVNFKQFEYNEFVSKFQKVTDSYFVEKIDGMLGALIFAKGYAYFSTMNNIKLIDLPVLDEYIKCLSRNRDIKEAVLIGELVAVKNNLILSFPELMSVVKTSRLPENKPLIHQYIYDIFSINSKKFTSYKESIQEIESYFKNKQRIHIPEYVQGDISDFKKLYAKAIQKKGIEGVVARLDDGKKNYKVKTTNSWDVCIIGAGRIDMKAWQKKQVSYLIVAFLGPDGTFRRTSNIGTGFTFPVREEFFNYIMDNKIDEQGGEIFVPPEKVIEVKSFRWRIKQAPSYKWLRGKYISLGNKTTVSLDMPSFLRVREDKKVNDYDVRLTKMEV